MSKPAALEAAGRLASEFAYGDTVPKAWLEDALGVSVPAFGSRREIERANLAFFSRLDLLKAEMLRTHKMLLVSNKSAGWSIVQPDSQTHVAMDGLQRGVSKAVREARAKIQNVNERLLSPEDIRARNDAAGKLAAFNAIQKQALK